jgi:hypothetical protein
MAEPESLNVAVTLTDTEWATIAGLLGAVLKMHEIGIGVGMDSALKLVEHIGDVKHASAVIQKAVMDAVVEDVIEHTRLPGE